MMNLTEIGLFKSKRFWSAVLGLVLMIAINFVPDLEANADMLQDTVLVIIGILIGGYTVVDAVKAAKGVPSKYDQ
jgi:uncharacterized membrane protein